MVRFPLSAAVLVALLGFGSQVRADPILINGSFEVGPLVGRGIEDFDIFAGETDIVGWTVLGGGVDYMNAPWDVADGIHAVDLDLRDSNGGIEQTFATVAGQQYHVSFQLSGNPGRSGGSLPVVKQVRVSVDGFSQDYAHDSTGQRIDFLVWDLHEFSFVASSTSATLRFTSLTPFPNSFGAMIDDVRVSAVPEPSTLLLMGAGLFGLVFRAKFRVARSIPLIAASLLAWSAPASADIITISSTSFARGVDVSHALEGATLQELSQAQGMMVWTPVRSPLITFGPWRDGPLDVLFGAYEIYEILDCADRDHPTFACLEAQGYPVLEVTFDTPVPYVSIVSDIGHVPAMYAYDSAGTLLLGCGPGGPGLASGCTSEWLPIPEWDRPIEFRHTATIARPQADIARVVWGGINGRAAAHQISYSVPEPGTLLLVTIGLVGACVNLTRRRANRFDPGTARS